MDWIILRTSGRNTLKLTDKLAGDGFETWSPIEVEAVEVPSKNVKRKILVPMLKGFVFARLRHFVDLLDLANTPGGKYPPFRVFTYLDRVPAIRDRDLNPLRRIAHNRAVTPKAQPLKKNQKVRAKPGAVGVEGMVGVVERSNERSTVVCFGGLFGRTELPTCLLSLEMLCEQEPQRKAA